jgi:hypothetical protein
MSVVSKIFVVLNLVFSIFFVGVAASVLAAKENYKEFFIREAVRRAEVEVANARIAREATHRTNELTADLTKANNEIIALSNKVTGANSAINDLKDAIGYAKNASDEAARASKNFASQADVFATQTREYNTRMEQLLNDKASLIREKDSYRIANVRLQNDVGKMRADYHTLEEQYFQVSRDYQVAMAMIDAARARNPQLFVGVDQPVSGRVVGVRGTKESNVTIVMISVGENEGVRRNQKFMIYRNETYIGQFVIDTVWADMAAGKTVEEMMRDVPKAGDSVRISTQ